MTRKSPAFSFYPDSWIGGTALMSSDEKAVYIDLLCVAWLHGGFTRQQALIFCRGVATEIVDLVINTKFHEESDGRFVNNRLEQERSKQQVRSENGKKGGRPEKAKRKLNAKLNESKTLSKTKHSVSDSVSVSDLISTTDSNSETEPPSEVLHGAEESAAVPMHGDPFSVKSNDGLPWSLPRKKFNEWTSTYGDSEWVDAQLKLARQWLADNPVKRKTPGGMTRFLGNWLSRANNRGNGLQSSPKKVSRVATAEDLASWTPDGGGQ